MRICSNQNILGDEGMFVVDYPSINERLNINDKIIIDYGAVVMTVIGFESEDTYLRKQEKKR
jgi:pyruvate kinase